MVAEQIYLEHSMLVARVWRATSAFDCSFAQKSVIMFFFVVSNIYICYI